MDAVFALEHDPEVGPAVEEEFRKIWNALKPSVKKALAEENKNIREMLTPQELEDMGVTEEPEAPTEPWYYDSLPAPATGGTWEGLSPMFYKQATNIWEHLKAEDREKLWDKVAGEIKHEIVKQFKEVEIKGVPYVSNGERAVPKYARVEDFAP